MANQAVDYLQQGILEAPDYDNMCMICHEEMIPETNNVKHKLECGHTYHSNCIITWFRTGNDNCPYCGDKGVNAIKKDKHVRRYFNVYFNQQKTRISKLRQISKRNDAPPKLVKFCERFSEIEKEREEIDANIKKLKSDETKHDNMSYKELTNMMTTLQKKKHATFQRYIKCKADIADYPVIPLIIPKIQT